MKPFQAIILVVFGFLALVAVFIFAGFSGRDDSSVGVVEIWGTLPASAVNDVLNAIQEETHSFGKVSYSSLPESNFSEELIEAIAAGRGPDLIIFSSKRILTDADKLTLISYDTLSRRAFQDTFIEAGEAYLTPSGILGIPFFIDPFVMYWNRTLYTEAGVALPPVYWDEFTTLASRLTTLNAAGTVIQSTLALGSWDNIMHAKDILVSLLRGLGNQVVARSPLGELSVVLADQGDGSMPAGSAALNFYTSFSDPAQRHFSWSRSQPRDRDAFLAGTLATYLAPASEAASLRSANPNLNFDAVQYPQIRGGAIAVPARLYALAVPNGSQNRVGAVRAALLMTSETGARALVASTGLPSPRRDILAVSPENPYEEIFRNAALNAFTFLDPDPEQSDRIFKTMVEDVTSGRLRISDAVRRGDEALRDLLH